VIAKTFFMAKSFRVYRMKFLHQEKSIRDHDDELVSLV